MRSLLRPFVVLFAVALAGCSSPVRVVTQVDGDRLQVKLFQGEAVEAVAGAGLDAPAGASGVVLTRGTGVTRVRVLERGDDAVLVSWHFVGEPDAQGAREVRPLGSLELQVQDDGQLALRAKGADAGTVGQGGVVSYELKDDGTVARQN